MAKFTAKFDLEDLISKKLRRMLKRLEDTDRLAKRLGLIEMKAKDGVSPTLRRVEKRLTNRNFQKHETLLLADAKRFEKTVKSTGIKLKRHLPESMEISFLADDRVTIRAKRIQDNIRRKLGKGHEYTIQANDKATPVMHRIANYAKRQLSKGYNFSVRAIDIASKTVGRIASYAGTAIPKYRDFTIRAIDRATSVVGAVKRALFSIPSMITVGLALVGVGSLGKSTVGAAMNFEGYEVAMEHWLDGNKKEADKLIKWMGQFADKTPFSSPDLFPALSRGIGLSGGDVKEAQRLLEIATNMAALTPNRTVADAMEALGAAQMGEFEMMKGYNIKMTKDQFDAMGGWSNFIDEVDQKFANGAEKFSQTATGQLSTLKGYTSAIFREAGKGILESMKPRLNSITTWIDNNQDKWNEWKNTVQQAGEQGAEWVFSKLEGTFSYIRDNYLENDEFKNLDFEGKIKFIMDDLGAWWDRTGRPWLTDVAKDVGSAIFDGIVWGVKEGIKSIGSMWVEAFKNPSTDNFAGAGISTLIATSLASLVLAPLIKGFGTLYKVGKWIFDRGKQLGGLFGGKRGGGPKGGSAGGRGGNRPPAGSPRTGRSPFISVGKFPSWLKKAGRRVPYLGPLLAGSALIGGDKDRLGANLGGLLGGIGGGAAAGAAVGSIFPGVGTTIGGIVGGIAGAFGGEKIGEWIQNSGILEKISDTLFNKEWWSEKWNSVTDYAKNLYEGSWLQDTITAIGDTLFSGDWWSQKWDGVTDFVDNKLLNASWWAEQAGYMYGYLESTVFSGEWWSQKWTDAGEWASNLYEGSWLEKTVNAISDTIFNKEWWGKQWENVKAYANERWHYWEELGNEVAEKLDRTIFNKEWWGQQWQNVKDWASERWQFWEDLGNEVAEKLDRTIFNKEWWSRKWTDTKAWAQQKWDEAQAVWESVTTRIDETIFNKEWWKGKWNDVIGWGRKQLEGLTDWWDGVKSSFDSGRQSGQAAARGSGSGVAQRGSETPYANGGFINRPHLGLVGEAGPEVIIPLSSNRRGRALDLYQKAGAALGVRPYANGGLVGGSVKMPKSQPVQASVNVGSVSVQADKQAKQYGEAITAAVASGINGTVVPINSWRKNNIETPMVDVVKEAVGFGSSTVRSFSTGQNATPTKTAAYLDRQVRSPFRVIQGGASQWGSGTVTGFRSGQDSTSTGTRPYLVSNVHTPFDETKGKGRGWGAGTASEFVTGMRSQSSQVTEAAKYLAKQVEKTFKEELGIHSPSRVMMELGRFASLGIVKGLGAVDIKKFAEKQAGSLAAAFSGLGAVGGNISQWIQAAMMITGVPSSWLGPLSIIAQKESGGNPRAINLWDINAKRGIPSKGLMQTIDPTFNAYKMPGMNDIYNPIHNAVAAIRYIQSRYGNVFNVPGIRSMARGGAYRGYANGGLITKDQIARVGEGNKREWIIPAERGIRGRYLLHQAAADLGMSVVNQGAGETVDTDTVQVATRPTSSSKVVVASEPSVQLIIQGDQHFYDDTDKEAWFREMEQRLTNAIREARENGASEVY